MSATWNPAKSSSSTKTAWCPSSPSKKSPIASCIFEYIYFARPDSRIYNTSVQKVRKRLGAILAQESFVPADVVVPVPDSSNMAATGYAEEAKIPYEMGLIRNHYIGRTFIEPNQAIRDFGARLKYNPVRESMEGKRVILIDDSIVRGTTMRKIVKMIRNAGAKEIHLRITSPAIISPCFYGMDFPSRKELIAATHSLEEIKTYLQGGQPGLSVGGWNDEGRGGDPPGPLYRLLHREVSRAFRRGNRKIQPRTGKVLTSCLVSNSLLLPCFFLRFWRYKELCQLF